MPVRLGCASDYNKNHPDRIRKNREEETVVLVANKRFGWLIVTKYYRTGSTGGYP
jgi:hypothetical protein